MSHYSDMMSVIRGQVPKTWPAWVSDWLCMCRDILSDPLSYEEEGLTPMDFLNEGWLEGFIGCAYDSGRNVPQSYGKYRYYMRRFLKMGLLP